MTAVLWCFVGAMLGAPLLGQALRWHDQIATRRRLEFARVERFPSILRRVEPTPWPQRRQIPTDLADAYQTPAPAPVRAKVFDGPTFAAREQAPIRVEADTSGCNVPCTARHCAEHRATGTEAQNGGYEFTEAVRRALFTPTADWSVSLLGLLNVPDFPPAWVEAT